SHRAIQIDAANNPGNSGGPVLQGDQVIGVAFQGMRGSAEGTGYIIPTPVIRRFLADIKNGHYDGYVDLGISTFKLFNAAQRRALGIPNDNKGVLVSRVYPKSSADGSLQANDILLEIDSYSILSDGRILLEGELVNLEEVVERKLHGESVALKILRGGEAQNVSFPLSTFEPARIHAVEYQTRPAYAMFGGLVFQPVSRNMLAAYAFDTLEIRKALDDYLNEDLYLERPELVVLTQVLTDSINADLAGVGGWVVDTINGEPVRKLADLVRILFEPLEAGTLPEFIVIRCRGAGRPFVLESRELAAAQRRIRAQYGISLDYRLPTPRGQTEW
ncbi:MAG: trypsin-like serine protease, partial [Kiritimatiellia bacterium]|nr:trypsin-like serine protease [Kiritimatiellia bacterium]